MYSLPPMKLKQVNAADAQTFQRQINCSFDHVHRHRARLRTPFRENTRRQSISVLTKELPRDQLRATIYGTFMSACVLVARVGASANVQVGSCAACNSQ